MYSLANNESGGGGGAFVVEGRMEVFVPRNGWVAIGVIWRHDFLEQRHIRDPPQRQINACAIFFRKNLNVNTPYATKVNAGRFI
jgi:hypothetical protein